jgi:alpha-N-arabinofuranosidase
VVSIQHWCRRQDILSRFVVNLSISPEAGAVRLTRRRHGAGAASGEVLTAARVDSVNAFDAPAEVAPKPIRATLQDGRLRLALPPRSVSVVELR